MLSARLSATAPLLALLLATTAARAGDLTLATADGPRHAITVPAGSGPAPTVIVLHGALGTGAGTLRSSGFAEAAARHGFAAVFPDGLDRQWHDGRTGGHGGPDDVAFLTALVGRLVADHVARPDRIYLAGISNGGMMSFTMACRAGDLFAGIGTVIATMPAGIEPCRLKPLPLVMINGTADPMVPFAGGGVGLRGRRGQVWSVERTLELFAGADGCGPATAAEPIPHGDPADPTHVLRIDRAGCQPGTGVTLYRIEGGGHALPGRPALSRVLLGPSNQDIASAEVIMAVFARR